MARFATDCPQAGDTNQYLMIFVSMSSFIGRQRELKQLTELKQKDSASLISFCGNLSTIKKF